MSAVAEHSQVSYEVQAFLNYTRNSGVKPVNYTHDPPAGVARNSGEIDARTVTMASLVLVSAAGGHRSHVAQDL
jgi:hypothetical protein